MITLISILAIFTMLIAWVLFEIAFDDIDSCNHEHFAEYRSRKVKQCIDCGLEVSIDATNW